MKYLFLIGILISFSGFFALNFEARAELADAAQFHTNYENKNSSAKNKQPVLIELFTAEGCPMCPSADRNLTFLQTEQPFVEADIITLALHVDYWNSRSWKDEFSSPLFSRRQDIYGQIFKISSIYTPQMVVDGQIQFAGTDLAKAQKAIIESAKTEKGMIALETNSDVTGDTRLKAKISDLPKHETSTVFVAITEDNLTPSRNRGENSAAKSAFTSVVRQLKSIGVLSAEQKNLETEAVLQFQPDWKKENLKLVVFVQDNVSRKIFAVSKINLNNNQ